MTDIGQPIVVSSLIYDTIVIRGGDVFVGDGLVLLAACWVPGCRLSGLSFEGSGSRGEGDKTVGVVG